MRRLFVRRTWVNSGQRMVFRTWTQEMSEPYRRCEKTTVVRVGGRHAIAFGVWGPPLAGEDAAMAAVFRAIDLRPRAL
ncbi:hypothetical protein [Streptomyces sp. UNOC14_S4]|uniref:hypothetical protein n=1 Tax=Streptomyces sp. UNOC14_S4 TaxID=2872340 RepID=UPI001E3DD820|nr:hypothetical protein [Streptomyces sp. UNOC14_S4]MCC3766451.1 hypothetical protein [Streptomyces sp. UNOC14_S4]